MSSAPRARVTLAALIATLIIASGLLVYLVIAIPASPAPAAAPSAAPSGGRGSPAGQVAAASPAPARRRHRDPLGGAAASYLATRAGTVLATVYDIGTGQAWNLGQQRPQAEASVVKLDILETLLAERGGDAGVPAGDRSLAQQMIEESDNDAATNLWYAVGGPRRISAFNAAAGLTHTTPSSCVDCTGFPWPGWGLTTTTPADQITLLRQLVEPGRLLSGADRHYALSLLENVTPAQRWGVSGGVPPQVTVALKDGWLPLNNAGTDWQINSVGWISGRGRNYLMAVLSTGNPSEQYGIDTISHVAAMVWANMHSAARA